MDSLTFDIRVWVSTTGDAGDSVDGFVCLKPQYTVSAPSLPSPHS